MVFSHKKGKICVSCIHDEEFPNSWSFLVRETFGFVSSKYPCPLIEESISDLLAHLLHFTEYSKSRRKLFRLFHRLDGGTGKVRGAKILNYQIWQKQTTVSGLVWRLVYGMRFYPPW